MLLRYHHLLCIQKFSGRGYDAAFTAHMAAVQAKLHAAPQTQITLTAETDILCGACPHRRSNRCDAQEKVTALDSAVRALVPHTKRTYPWEVLQKAARTRILETDAFHKICKGCQWYALCSETEATNGTGNQKTAQDG